MAPDKKEKKRKEAPSAAASSEAPQKKPKKQKVTEDTAASPSDVPKTDTNHPNNTAALAAADINEPAVKSKRDRKRAADFLSGQEEEDHEEPKGAATKPKKKAKKRKHEKSETTEAPALEAAVATEDAEITTDPKPLEKAKVPKATTFDVPTKPTKKIKKSALPEVEEVVRKVLSNGNSLTADGVNGILEHSSKEDVEVTTANEEPSTSMQAEAQRTVQKEMADEIATEDEIDDQGATLLAGFDSESDDPGQDEGLDPANMGDLDLNKVQRKKLRQAVKKGSKEGPGTVYVGRIPRGFYETQMRQYFSQFGTITNLRLSRNKTTGASKHFAFIEFESNEVAKIVAQTMDNYLMFGHILKCKYAPTESLHPDTWKGANKRFKKVPYNKIEKRKLEEPKTKDQWEVKIAREQSKRDAKAERMKSFGYEYEMPQIQTVDAALERKALAQPEETKAVESAAEEEQPTRATETPSGIPKDAVAMKKSKKPKQMKVESETDPIVPVAAVDDQLAVSEPAKKTKKFRNGAAAKAAHHDSVVPEVVAESQPAAVEKSKTAKKVKKGAAASETVGHDDVVPDVVREIALGPFEPGTGKRPKKLKKGAALSEVVENVSALPEVIAEPQPAAVEPGKKVKKTKKGAAAREAAESTSVVLGAVASDAVELAPVVPEIAVESQPAAVGPEKKAKKAKKAKTSSESVIPALNGEAQTETTVEVTKDAESRAAKRRKKQAVNNTAPVETSSSTALPEVEPPRFAFHPDEIAELTKSKPKKQRKGEGTDQAAAQMQLNAELNDAAEPLKNGDVESDAEIAATAAVLPTPGGGKRLKTEAHKEKRKADAVAEAVKPLKVKKMKKKTPVS